MVTMEEAKKAFAEFEQKLIRNGLRFAAGRPGAPSSGVWSAFWNGSDYEWRLSPSTHRAAYGFVSAAGDRPAR